MTLTYIFHSCFALESEDCMMVFDYWMDPEGAIPTLLSKGKPVYVFVSHFHEDHFNPAIFEWRETYPQLDKMRKLSSKFPEIDLAGNMARLLGANILCQLFLGTMKEKGIGAKAYPSVERRRDNFKLG